MTRPAALPPPPAEADEADPIAQVAKLRALGATAIEVERTRGGTWRIRATWAKDEAPQHQWGTGRK